jgi:predicted 3-demethylubiquinone-9 3-methyltransferase (glyoxalase superfamily)
MATIRKITPCLWFDDQAEEAARHYVSIFGNSRIIRLSRYDKGQHKPEGSVLTVVFELAGQEFMALNGGPEFKFSQAISMSVGCDTQAEIDYFWDKLSAGGEPGQCGWLKDRFGLSWQVVPSALGDMLRDAPDARASHVLTAVRGMRKLDFAALQRAYDGRG